MDHLAHVVLAGRNPLAVTGALLGDFWRGALDPAWPAALAAGVRLHRRIDTWTDGHPAVLEARAGFDPGFRRYAGIALDVWFDHLLANDFERRAGETLAVVEDRVRACWRAPRPTCRCRSASTPRACCPAPASVRLRGARSSTRA